MRPEAEMLRRERMARNWSQEGLCKGICAVSYLSKIEKGKADPSPEILRALMERLGCPWITASAEQKERVEAFYEALLDGDHAFQPLREEIISMSRMLAVSDCTVDLMLLEAFTAGTDRKAVPQSWEVSMTTRQLALQRLLQDRYEDAMALMPCAFTYAEAGLYAYEKREELRAMELLRQCYDLAAREGRAYWMLEACVFWGNVCSDLGQTETMMERYRIARRLARALGENELILKLDYNVAATQLMLGDVRSAWRYFSCLEEPDRMDLHKLAVCQERMGMREEALRTIHLAYGRESNLPEDVSRMMLEVVEYRLTHPDFLHDPDYMELLECCMKELEPMPKGFAQFHAPELIACYSANRRYKDAMRLMRDFPPQ